MQYSFAIVRRKIFLAINPYLCRFTKTCLFFLDEDMVRIKCVSLNNMSA